MTVSDEAARVPQFRTASRGLPVVILGRVIVLAALLVAWELGYRRLGDLYLAGPVQVATRVVQLFGGGDIWGDLAATLWVAASGTFLGWLAGVALPLLLSTSTRATAAIEPYILGSMGVPKFALVPLLIVWFGIGAAPKIVVVALMTFYVIFITTFAGLRAIDRRLIAMARILGAPRRVIVVEVIGRSLTPFLFAGLKVALPRALSATIVGEFLVAERGLGHMIENSRQMADTVGVFAGIVIVVLLVLGLNSILQVIHRRLQYGQSGDVHKV